MITRYFVDESLSTKTEDSKSEHHYELMSEGNDERELINEACVFEINKYGESIKYYTLHDAPHDVYDEVVRIIRKVLGTV